MWYRKISKNSVAKIFPFSPPPSFPKSCSFSTRVDSCFDKVLTMYGGPRVGQGICRDCSIRTGCFCEVPRLSWDTWRPLTSFPSLCVWRRSVPIDRPRLKACPSTARRYKLWVCNFFAVLHRDIGHLTQGTDLCGTRQSFTTPMSSAVSLISSRLFHHPLPPGIHTYIHTYIHTHTYIHPYIHKSIHPSIHTYIHTHIHTHIHTYIYTYIHTHIHTYIHTNIRTYVHTYTHIQDVPGGMDKTSGECSLC